MNREASAGRRLRFGPFLLDVQSGELAKGRSCVRLAPQPARVLALLAGRPGVLFTRDDLRREIWGDDTYVDFDQALNFCIRKVRAALDDDAGAPRYIETLARRGYRFIAAVAEEDAPAQGRTPASGLAVTLAAAPQQAEAERVMLAVLPFENLSGNPEQDYFSDGLTAEMIARLGRLDPHRLGVIARTSSMRYKRRAASLSQVARELGVQYLLEGSLRRSDARVRVSAQLIRATDQSHLWAETYDRPLSDVLAMQADLARCIAREIRLTLAPGPPEGLPPPRAVVPDSYQAYLRGLVFMNESSSEATRNAVACFDRALAADADFAPAHAALSLSWSRMGFHNLLPPREAEKKARAAALRCIEIDDDCAEGHAALARVALEFTWNFEEAEREALRALAINPNDIVAHHWLAHLQVALGRADEGVLTSRRAIELDPYDHGIHAHLAWHYILTRRYDEAVAQSRRTLVLDRNSFPARIHLGWALLHQGALDEAIRELSEASNPSRGENIDAIWSLGHACAVAGDVRRARRILRDLTGPRQAPFGAALIHLGLGEPAKALRRLEEAYEQRHVQMIYLGLDPRFDPLHQDPRFRSIVERIGLPLARISHRGSVRLAEAADRGSGEGQRW